MTAKKKRFRGPIPLKVLLRLERLLRKFIDEEMTKAFGPNWMKHRLPNGLR